MKTCCFFGHRKIKETDELKHRLINLIDTLIIQEKVDTFLFGSKSRFNDICLELVTKAKEKHTHIMRVYVRAEFPHIDNKYKEYLLNNYEETYFPENIIRSGKAAYVERNFEMINKSDFCVIYYDKENLPTNRKSGTKIACEYANKKDKVIINVACNADK